MEGLKKNKTIKHLMYVFGLFIMIYYARLAKVALVTPSLEHVFDFGERSRVAEFMEYVAASTSLVELRYVRPY